MTSRNIVSKIINPCPSPPICYPKTLSKAQATLGEYHLHGLRGCAKDTSAEGPGWHWTSKAAHQGSASAQYNLSASLSHRGSEDDLREAVKWLTRAAKAGMHQAQNNLGESHTSTPWASPQPAGRKASRFTSNCDSVPHSHGPPWCLADLRVGIAYEHGRGVPKDIVRAVEWYELAGVQGNTTSQINCGRLYKAGIGGVKKDEERAILWWTKVRAATKPAVTFGTFDIRPLVTSRTHTHTHTQRTYVTHTRNARTVPRDAHTRRTRPPTLARFSGC